MKRPLSRLLVVTFLTATAPGLSLADDPICGDLNATSSVTTADALLVLKKAVGQDVALRCPPLGALTKSGQESCWDPEVIGAPFPTIACEGTGQDGATAAGLSPSFTDNGDGTLTDNNTGLTWEKLDNNNTGGIHDKDNPYIWTAALDKVAQLNAENFAGHSDWRLPNVRELHSLLDFGDPVRAYGPELNSNCTPGCVSTACSCTNSLGHWTSTTMALSPEFAWAVYFGVGDVSGAQKDSGNYARAVRGGL